MMQITNRNLDQLAPDAKESAGKKSVQGQSTAFSNVMKQSGSQGAKNAYFNRAEGGFVTYNGVSFKCNEKSGALELGDCSRRDQCIRVPLSGGGSLLFNADSIEGVTKAMGMFTAEDQGRIMRAIQMYNMAKDKLKEIEEDENADPEEEVSEEEQVDEASADGATDGEEVDWEEPAEISKSYISILKERSAVYEIYDIVDIA